MAKTVLIAGASGIVGFAALKHFSAEPGTQVIGLSRRAPPATFGARIVPVDLADAVACARLAPAIRSVTHLVYTALYEKPELLAGWVDPDQIATNAAMFRNILEVVDRHARDLRHVTILQGTKAYGIHVRPIPAPAREDRDEAHDVPNFYWEQERLLKETAVGRPWHWTIFRPQGIFGESFGSAMNVIAALGVYGAILKDERQSLHYPGGNPNIMEAIDADILARAIGWAGETPNAQGQAFNITNGDVFMWQNVWPVIAEALGMRPGEVRPMSLAETMAGRGDQWNAIRLRYELVSPPLEQFVGLSFQFADSLLDVGDPTRSEPGIVSTVKLRRAGFCETLDTEAMLRKWFRLFQEKRLLPPA